ncbi:unnamed protein product [Caenorhabditis auriculariae]|uniref:Uncharacterized protein n=1 Tax=Caenorhabditis auriculariae TaxID=2777116 RepID=A0A8S1HQN7_9PELO|nr:unnamed protein product [Caenorhabditis auriculariae]
MSHGEIQTDEYAYRPIPPPTQQPSDAQLVLTLLHLVCLTSALCGNVSQFVLQLYTHRHRDGYPVQHLLTIFFGLNVAVSLGIPWLIVTTLVRYWTFGKAACRIYQGSLLLGKITLPYVISFLYILLVTTQLKKVNPEDNYSLIFETFDCDSAVEPPVYPETLRFLVEFLIPFSLTSYFALRLRSGLKASDLLFTTLHGCSANLRRFTNLFPSDLDVSDYSLLLPYFSSALTWIPAANISSLLASFQIINSPTSPAGEVRSCRVVRLLVPPQNDHNSPCRQPLDSREHSGGYSMN